jgi:hypothetical protein
LPLVLRAPSRASFETRPALCFQGVTVEASSDALIERVRIQPMLDVYNALNAAPVLAYNNTFGPEWLRPTDVLQGRLVKVGPTCLAGLAIP